MQRVHHRSRVSPLILADVSTHEHVDFPFGRVHYNMERPAKLVPRLTVPLTRGRQSEWMPFVDLFIYCTRREMLRLPQHDQHDDGVTYHVTSSTMYPNNAELGQLSS